jgi:hypothetical protein
MTKSEELKYKVKSDYSYWSDILVDDDDRKQQGRRRRSSGVDDVEAAGFDDTIASSRVRTLPKNLIRPLPVQYLEGEGFRRPALPSVDARRWSDEENYDDGAVVSRDENWDEFLIAIG